FKNPDFEYWQLVTHMFMHGSVMHILFNMYALWAFGSPLEQMWGRNKFIFFYFSAGLGAAFIHTLVNYFHFQTGYDAMIQAGISSDTIQSILCNQRFVSQVISPTLRDIPLHVLQNFDRAYDGSAVGAAGAISGILVAFAMMFPNVELFLIFVPIPIKAKYFIPVLLLLDLFP